MSQKNKTEELVLFENCVAKYHEAEAGFYEWRIYPLGWEIPLVSGILDISENHCEASLKAVEKLMAEKLLAAKIRRLRKAFYIDVWKYGSDQLVAGSFSFETRKKCRQFLKAIDPNGLIRLEN